LVRQAAVLLALAAPACVGIGTIFVTADPPGPCGSVGFVIGFFWFVMAAFLLLASVVVRLAAPRPRPPRAPLDLGPYRTPPRDARISTRRSA
jgi:hypothetical protein